MSPRPPLIALKDVTLADGPNPLFDGVDLALEPRARAALVGRNGAGKTTLLRLLAGLIEADDGQRFVQPGVRFALVTQEPKIEGPSLLAWAAADAPEHEAAAALESFGLDPDRSPDGLSGGEIRRAALARAFASDPDVLLLDEPTNHLDIVSIQALEARLARTRAAVLTISHDRAFLTKVTKTCFWLEGRKVRRLDEGFGAFDAWSRKLAAEEAEALHKLGRAIERETATFYSSITARRTRNEGRARALQALRAERAKRLSDRRGELDLKISAGEASGKLVAEIENVSKSYGERTLFRGFSTRIMRGDRVAIVGPNGAGKTTLVKTLLGEIEPDQGSVRLGANLTTAYADQSRAKLPEGATLWEALAPEGGDQILVHGQPRHVAAYARDFLFQDRQLRQPISSLSGGERNRLLLALALARPANVLVLDEPTNDLDMDTMDLLEEALADYAGTLILVSHDRDFIDRLATSTIALDGNGRVVETPGGWQDFVRQNPGFLDPAPETPQKRAAGGSAEAAASGAPAKRQPAKLSYKDQRRLDELDRDIPKFQAQITELEARLADPALFEKDPDGFGKLAAKLEQARADLAAAEDEWLELEERREMLAGG